jgi:23S rRNA (adenine2503-C2)-methyltransferase
MSASTAKPGIEGGHPPTTDKPALLGASAPEIATLLTPLGQPAFRARQVYAWLHARGAAGFTEMSDLPKALRDSLDDACRTGRTAPSACSEAADGTRKYLFDGGGGRFVESAYIPDGDRATLCLSTQVGCRMGCLFCATARQGFQSNLPVADILNQYYSLPERERITNIVYMGMGEPMDNIDAVLRSLTVLTDAAGAALSPRRITVSTVGLLPGLERFLAESEANLALSLHSPFDDERCGLMPVQRLWPVDEVVAAIGRHDFSGQRRLSFEYIMFDGVNDSQDHARALAKLAGGLPVLVNLIHYHSVPGNVLHGSPRPVMEAFQATLKAAGLQCTIRRSRGEDIQAACGLLSTKALVRKEQRDLDY